jgi:hypothetical protein
LFVSAVFINPITFEKLGDNGDVPWIAIPEQSTWVCSTVIGSLPLQLCVALCCVGVRASVNRESLLEANDALLTETAPLDTVSPPPAATRMTPRAIVVAVGSLADAIVPLVISEAA